ncbi:MAG: glycosyltransferase family 87 protein, partial [Acidimicrobiales bacterium]
VEEAAVPAEITESWRLRWYPRALLAALAIAFAVVLAGSDGSATVSGRLGGDYPAFHAAGELVLSGDIDRLYDPDAQAEAQAGLLGGESGFLPFAYPPHVAAAYAPLAALDYRLAYALHTTAMVGALLWALRLLGPMVSLVRRFYWPTAAAAVSCWPIFRAIGGGQNTSLTILALAVVWRALHDDHEWVAGLAAGLLLFRPQYGLPIIGLLLLARHRMAVVTAFGVGTATWLANAGLLGFGWFREWADRVGPFVETDARVNARNAVAWLGFSAALGGAESAIALLIGGSLAVATAVALAGLWWRADTVPLDVRMAVTATGLVLLSPHAMFYDAGLALPAVIVAVDRRWLSLPVTSTIWALSLLQLTAGWFEATPLALVVMAGFAALLARTLTRRSGWAPALEPA